MTMVEIERTDHNPGWRAFVTGSSRPHGWLKMEEAKWGLHPLMHTFYSEGQTTTSWYKANGAKVII